MRIIFLGSTDDIRYIAPNRTCGGIVLQIGQQILIDPGIGTIINASRESIDLSNSMVLTSSNDIAVIGELEAIKQVYYTTQHDIKVETIVGKKNSFKIETDKCIISYITYVEGKKFSQNFKDTNIMIIKANIPKEQMINLIEDIKPELTVITGWTTQDPLDFSRELKKSVNIEKNIQIIHAKDSMAINLDHYNIQKKQKSLDSF
jgi:hypothetical protein